MASTLVGLILVYPLASCFPAPLPYFNFDQSMLVYWIHKYVESLLAVFIFIHVRLYRISGPMLTSLADTPKSLLIFTTTVWTRKGGWALWFLWRWERFKSGGKNRSLKKSFRWLVKAFVTRFPQQGAVSSLLQICYDHKSPDIMVKPKQQSTNGGGGRSIILT